MWLYLIGLECTKILFECFKSLGINLLKLDFKNVKKFTN